MGKNKADNEAAAAVVMAPKPGLSGRKKTIVIVVAIVLPMMVAGGVWYWLAGKPAATKLNDPKAVTNSPKYQQATKDSDKLRAAGEYDQAKTSWQAYLDDANATEEEKYKAHLKIAALDETKGDCKAALVNYYAAEKLTDRTYRAETEAIARCSERLQDWATAQKYYQKALDTFPGGEDFPSDQRYYRSKIEKMKQALEAQQ